LFPIEKINSDFKADSLTIVWLDKDQKFGTIEESSDKHYHIQIPTEREFLETCNEFWWLTIYVSKGLLRNQVTYAKEMLETGVQANVYEID
jgi:aminoglycoside 6-adenylyltransferase